MKKVTHARAERTPTSTSVVPPAADSATLPKTEAANRPTREADVKRAIIELDGESLLDARMAFDEVMIVLEQDGSDDDLQEALKFAHESFCRRAALKALGVTDVRMLRPTYARAS